MNKDQKTKEYFGKWENIKLSDSSRARMQEKLLEYSRFHSVRVGEDSRFSKQVPQRTSLLSLRSINFMPIAILIAVMIGGGTSFAAGGAVPGDFLYPVKTEVNETVLSAFTFGADAEARLQARILEERVEEAEELKAEGRLSGELALVAKNNIETQSQKTIRVVEDGSDDVRADIKTRVELALENYNATVATDTSTRVNIANLFSGQVNIATELNDDLASVSELRASTETRLSNLVSVMKKSQAEISASVASEINAKLNTATELYASLEVQAEAKARETLSKIAELLGEVEAKLTTLGTASIDSDTGAIIDIDFTNVPPASYFEGQVETETRTDSDSSTNTGEDNDSPVDVELDIDTGTEINTDVIDTSIDTDTSVRGGLSL